MASYKYATFDYKGTPVLVARMGYEGFMSLNNQAVLVRALEAIHPDKAILVQGPNIRGVDFIGLASEPKKRAITQELFSLIEAGNIRLNLAWTEAHVNC